MNGAWAGFVFIVVGLGLVGAAVVCDLRRYVERDSQPAEFPAPEDLDAEDEERERLPIG